MKKENKIIKMLIIFMILASTCAVFIPQVSADPIGLVAAWHFDEGSGTVANDATSNDNDGTLYYGPTWTPVAKYGPGAVHFDGVDDYIKVPTSTSLQGVTTQVSVEAWVRVDDVRNAMYVRTPFDSGGLSYGIDRWGGLLRFYIYDSATNPPFHICSKIWTPNINTWYHICGTYNGTILILYLNGNLFESLSYTGDIDPSYLGVVMGARYQDGTQDLHKGYLDEVRIYDYALSSEVITDHYNLDYEPSIASAGGPYSGNEGTSISLTGSATHPENGPLTYSWDLNNDDDFETAGQSATFNCIDDGIYPVNLKVIEGYGRFDIDSTTVEVNNVAPTADAGEDKIGNEPSTFTFTGSHTDPGTQDTHTYEWDFDYNGITFDIEATGNDVSKTWYDDFNGDVALRVTDDDDDWNIDTCHVTVNNVAPTTDAGEDKIGNEPSTFTFTGSHTDPGTQDTHTYEWDFDYNGITFDIEATGNDVSKTWYDDFNGDVALRVTDDDDDWNIDTCHVTVNNVAPSITTLTISPSLLKVNNTIILYANFTDLGTEDTHTAMIDWNNDGTYEDTNQFVTSPIQATHIYADTGVYKVNLKVEDDDLGSDTEIFQYVVVYDPSDGFVTGGGWINSPEGAYYPDPELTGTANFGFVSKYKKGQQNPTGNTEFQFQVADLNFHSSSYQWLVIAGAKAMYKGTGTINGAGNYGFMISAIDEKLTNNYDTDMFRIKIWDKDDNDEVIYDNQLGADEDDDPSTEIAGGQIVIHKA